MIQWAAKEPTPGAQIRVNRGMYFHHGIYIGDGEVVHFAGPDNDGIHTPDVVHVRRATLAEFLAGGMPEVRQYTFSEKRSLRKPDAIISAALARVGEGGYDVLYNNCEHFSNECAFGKRLRTQVEEYRDEIRRKLKEETP